MMPIDWRKYIESDPAVCHGKACLKGTRVLVSTILDNLAAGESPQSIRESYAGVTDDAIHAAIAYAADLARERTVAIP